MRCGWMLRFRQARLWGIDTVADVYTCLTGMPGSSICELAQNWGAHLIVLGRWERQGMTEVMMGSVSNYVIHHEPCSGLVVQGIMRNG